VTSALKFTTFYHIAELSQCPGRDDFRMIAFAGNPDNAARLIANGFVQLQSIMPTFRSPLYEFSEHHFENEPQHVRQATLSLYMHMWRLPRLGSGLRRRVLRTALSTCKRLSTFRTHKLDPVA
jgi:hypothetical protein